MTQPLPVSPPGSNRILGVLGILGGLALLAAFIPGLPWTYELFNLRLVLFNVGAIAVAFAVHRRQAVSRLALAVAVLTILANAWYLVMIVLSIGRPIFPAPDPGFRPIFFYAAIALWLTDALFGWVAARLGVVSRWAAIALAVGSLLTLTGMSGLGFTTSSFAPLVGLLSLAGVALVGIGWAWLGVDVATHPLDDASSGAPGRVK